MVVDQLYVRLTFLLGAVGILFALRKPLRYPDKPGSKGFVVLVFALALWLGSSGLSYFVPSLRGTLVLYNFLLFAIMVSAVGWVLMAVEFATRRLPSRRILVALGALLVVHFAVLWTNYFGVHELMYRSSTTVEDAVLAPVRGPLFWGHAVIAYALIVTASVLLVAEWVNASALRRRQAGLLAVTPAIGLVANVLWLTGVVDLPFDPTPIGTTAGVVVLSYALYRAEFLTIAPVARQTVVEEMSDGVVILDEEDRVVDWNRAAEELFGVDDAAPGTPASEFLPPEPAATVAELAGSGQSETRVSFERDGRPRHASVMLSSVERAGERPLGRIVVVRDVTSLVRRERQLVKQNEYLDEFAGIVSHDLQGPLMRMRANADLAVKTDDVEPVGDVLDAADRMEELVDDLLDLARSGQRIEATEPVSVADAADAVWRRVWSPDAEIVVETDAVVQADPDRLQQLLENLFRNAVEHGSTSPDSQARRDAVEHGSTSSRSAPTRENAVEHDREPATGREGSRSTAAAGAGDDGAPGAEAAAVVTGAERASVAGSRAESDRDGEAEAVEGSGAAATGDADLTVTVGSLLDGFYVEDDGPGIPDAERERVFERGYTTTEDGTGLGLGIVRQIAGAHGWSVRATEGSDGGARVEITGVEFERS